MDRHAGSAGCRLRELRHPSARSWDAGPEPADTGHNTVSRLVLMATHPEAVVVFPNPTGCGIFLGARQRIAVKCSSKKLCRLGQ